IFTFIPSTTGAVQIKSVPYARCITDSKDSGLSFPLGKCFGIVQTGHPFAGVFNTRFQLQRFVINHSDYRRIGDRADIRQSVMQQYQACAIREILRVPLREQDAMFDFAIRSIQRAQATVQ
ncbi:hypothetical protein AABH71_005314, partial [Salmonella enterica]|nr:hypothetical protein [Salmonella enterica]EBQ9005374.1 hypothetical protein [Salmonella enterica subsp. enterica serovar Blockley]ECD6162167.1 hypothetical protein [Salmonella enterica subsp. enterica]ECU7995237.1 hypothetical protein [Salmonella enterica subsp. enterica serovar Toucra]EAW3045929.1 hypothetical protein [Salmonella enterica]